MTQNEIIDMARQAQSIYGTDTWTFALCANQLEACAKVCEEYASANTSWTRAAVKDCAAIIRARGEQA